MKNTNDAKTLLEDIRLLATSEEMAAIADILEACGRRGGEIAENTTSRTSRVIRSARAYRLMNAASKL